MKALKNSSTATLRVRLIIRWIGGLPEDFLLANGLIVGATRAKLDSVYWSKARPKFVFETKVYRSQHLVKDSKNLSGE